MPIGVLFVSFITQLSNWSKFDKKLKRFSYNVVTPILFIK